MNTLLDILYASAEKYPNQEALTMKMGYRIISYTYANILAEAQKTALFLQSQNIKKNDRVIIIAPNSPYYVILFFACILIGAIPVPLNIQSTQDQIDKIIEQTEAKLIFTWAYFKQIIRSNHITYVIELLPELISKFDNTQFYKQNILSSDTAEILYTSGTTGDPKGVVLTHENICSNLEAIAKIIILTPKKDRLVSILPLSHVLEQTIGLLLPLMHGAQIIYAHSPSALRKIMNEYQITKMVAVPEFLNLLMSRIEEQTEKKSKGKFFQYLIKLSIKLNSRRFSRILFYPIRRQLSSTLDTVSCGGAPLDPMLEQKWEALGIFLLQGYGLTETSPVVATNTFEEHRLGSVGKILENLEVKIAKDKEILVKGPSVFHEYYKNPKLTQEVFTQDGFFKTGDLGEFDKDGFLYIRGRKKYVIIGPGGQNVYPEDIEEILNKIPEVIDSAVLGIERQNGIEIHAVLLLKDATKQNPELIIEKANKKLASYQQITAWTVWPEIDFPRSATRKVQKEKVKKFLQEKGVKKISQPGTTTQLIKLISNIANIEPTHISNHTKLRELHLDSLMRIELISRIEEDFEILLNEANVNGETSIEQLQTMINSFEIAKEPPKLKKWPQSIVARLFRPILQYFFYLLLKPWMKLKIRGLENLKDIKKTVIFMPNHLSYVDPLVLAMALPYDIRKKLSYAAAYDVLYAYPKPLVWLAELSFNTFPFPRREQEHIGWGLKNVGAMLDRNHHIVLFPEGLISETGQLRPIKQGAGLLAITMDSDIVPVYIKGTNTIFPYYTFFPRAYSQVIVTFGKPITISKTLNYQDATKIIEQNLKELAAYPFK